MIFQKYKVKALIVSAVLTFSYSHSKAQQMAENSDSLQMNVSQKISVLYGDRVSEEVIGNLNSVSGEELSNYPSLTVQEALAGKLPGLFILQNNGNIGENDFQTFIRGSFGGYVVLIDGIERSMNNLPIEQIAEIKVFKDAVTRAMYGGKRVNGIIAITTKRGQEGKNEFRATIQRGVKMPTVLPEYLNSAEFASYYNQALKNDYHGVIPEGLGYSAEEIQKYKDQSDPLAYPDVDYYGKFLNNSMNITRINTEYYGGGENTRMYFHAGFQDEGGFEKQGNNGTEKQMINLRGNLDANFSDHIKVFADLGGYIGKHEAARSFNMSTLSNRRPNAYPLFVGVDSLGGTSTFKDNPYGGMEKSGFVKTDYLTLQTLLGFEFDLENVVKGLSIKPSLGFDIEHVQAVSKNNTPGIYSYIVETDGNSIIQSVQDEVMSTSNTMGDDEYRRHWALNVQANWSREFGDHSVNSDLVYYMSKLQEDRVFDNARRQNIGLRTHYGYKAKYFVEGALSYTGSPSYAKGNRFKLFPALGAAWLVSKENFMENSSAIDFLKVNATWGKSGNADIGMRLYDILWKTSLSSNAYKLNKSQSLETAQFNIASSNLDWPTMREIDINIEARLWKRLGVKVSYFDYLTEGNLSKASNAVPGILGGTDFLPYRNFGETALKGSELELSYFGKKGDWTYSINTHLTYSKSEKLVVDEINDPLYSTVGDATDDIRGYNAIGTYSQADIDAAMAGTGVLVSGVDPNDLRVGSIKYQDVNSDGIIDKYDNSVIGNSTPRLMYGANFNVGYKNFSLYASFLGYGKYDRLINSSFYHNYDTRKYSTVVKDGLPNGNAHPLLTTSIPTNDTKVSDYWIVDGSFFKLKNVRLSYTLPKHISESISLGEVKFYVYGSNLFTTSKIKDSDPESLQAGVNAYPLFSTYAGGISISF